jgi:hypothetical protein
MKNSVMLLAITSAIAVTGSAFFLRDSSGNKRVLELEREVASLHQKLQASALPAAPIANTTAAASIAESASAKTDMATLTRQMEDLFAAIGRLQQSAEELDQRISRSKLALPTRQEREVRVAQMQRELDARTQKSQETAAELLRIARQYGVQLDPRALSSFDFPTPLDKHPDFIEARTRAIQAARIREAAEKKFASELIEYQATPP